MWFLDQIISWLTSARDAFANAYIEVSGWVFPFYYLATPLYGLFIAFGYLAIYFSSFNNWVDDAVGKLATILSYTNIYSYFEPYFTAAIGAWNWVINSGWNILTVINGWWNTVSTLVQSWIDSAKNMLLGLLGNIEIWLGNLQQAWDSFVGMIPSISEILSWFTDWWGWILARIISWGALPAKIIQALIDSTLLSWFPFYDTFVQIWNEIVAFFTNPWDYIEAKFVNWWLGPE